jgi:hypothetical protein
VSAPEQFTLETGFKTERQAIAAWPSLRKKLRANLRAHGYVTFTAPEMPLSEPDSWRGETVDGCRCLTKFILPWLPSPYANQFATRVDTIATKGTDA